ncbi:MAG: hypothetical protein C0465_17905 [Ralstonia sp.]|uniref:hypothetical protein n=1 Tax=Ralstonia sp. TaxID=54061 RepID=UPI00257C7A70|nr:hypothetical protein [Ralstonia sp.]MBA4232476.1 hypothetical protein [Ralstonia sp.]
MFWATPSSKIRRAEVREFFTHEPSWWRRMIRDEGKLSSLHEKVIDAKRRDFGIALNRAFFETNVNISELEKFRIADLASLDATNPDPREGQLFQNLMDHSVFLYGFPGIADRDRRNFAIRALKLKSNFIVEYNPIKISILFLTKKQLILHEERLNLFAGRPQSMSSCSIFLKDIAIVEKIMVSDLITKEELKENEARLPVDILERNMDVEIQRHALRIVLVNRITYDLPIGAPILVIPDDMSSTGWDDGIDGEIEQKTLKAKRAIAGRIVDAKRANT